MVNLNLTIVKLSVMLNRLVLFLRKKIARLMGKSYIRVGKCNQCGFCCTLVTLFIDSRPVRTKEEFEYLKEIFPEYKRFKIRGKDADGHLLFTCKYLTKDFKCGDYKGRPSICREYPNQDLLMKGGKLVSKCGYSFIPVENFQKILDETLSDDN